MGQKIFRSSHRELFYEKCVLKAFAKFTGNRLCRNFFFNKVAGLLLKKRLRRKCFPVYLKTFTNSFFYKTPPVSASGFSANKIKEKPKKNLTVYGKTGYLYIFTLMYRL